MKAINDVPAELLRLVLEKLQADYEAQQQAQLETGNSPVPTSEVGRYRVPCKGSQGERMIMATRDDDARFDQDLQKLRDEAKKKFPGESVDAIGKRRDSLTNDVQALIERYVGDYRQHLTERGKSTGYRR